MEKISQLRQDIYENMNSTAYQETMNKLIKLSNKWIYTPICFNMPIKRGSFAHYNSVVGNSNHGSPYKGVLLSYKALDKTGAISWVQNFIGALAPMFCIPFWVPFQLSYLNRILLEQLNQPECAGDFGSQLIFSVAKLGVFQ